MSIRYDGATRIFSLETAHALYQMQADRHGVLLHLYWGARTDCAMDYLLQYAEMTTRYADSIEKLDAIGETELSPAGDAYYIEVMSRIEVKLLEAANYMQ